MGRSDIQEQLDTLSFGSKIWLMFRAVISGTLESLGDELGCAAQTAMKRIDLGINDFFIQSLQLDDLTLRFESE